MEAGHDVIVSDADALWLADPMKDFSLPGVIDSSIVASRGKFPSEVGLVWGATMCMGFILFRTTASRAAMREFVAVMNALVLEKRDDQIAVCMEIVWRILRESQILYYRYERDRSAVFLVHGVYTTQFF